jgi:hypothetical protein
MSRVFTKPLLSTTPKKIDVEPVCPRAPKKSRVARPVFLVARPRRLNFDEDNDYQEYQEQEVHTHDRDEYGN